MTQRHALVAGATGLVGRRIAERLTASGWHVTGLCRHPPVPSPPWQMLAVDLTVERDCREKLEPFRDVTHVFYAARYDDPEGTPESVEINTAMLVNLVDAIEPVAAGLQHVHMVHGSKYYGHMLGPLPLPLREDAPRAPVANFYFDHEDFIRERQRGKRWTYSTSRPHAFCDANASEPRNAALLIAMHATLARAAGEPLVFPGTEQSFHVRTQFTFVPMLARAVEWMAVDPQCANESFNVVNGDAPSWSALWRQFAEYFDLPCGAAVDVCLAEIVRNQGALWQALVERHDLQRVDLEERVLWRYADYLFSPRWDIVSSMSKARSFGFEERVDSARMFLDLFETFRRERIIP
jgi:nucleoside-diphosphate-sugar epimerase